VRLGILTDIHLSPPDNPADGWHNPHQFKTVRERLAKSIRWLETEGVDRIAVLGDLTHHGDEAPLREVIEMLGASNVPIWVLPGNHDLTSGSATFAGAIEAFGRDMVEVIGSQPVPLDDAWRVAGLPIERASDGAGFVAAPASDPHKWGDGPVLLLSHFPVLSLRKECVEADLKYAGDLTNAREVATLLLERPGPTFVINGHLHVRHAASQGSVLQAACGAQVESLFEATLVDFGNWDQGCIAWTATPMEPVWPGVSPALTIANQAWTWDGVAWRS